MSTAIDYVREELRLLRVQVKLSQDDFGRGIGYSGSHVSSVETGGRPPTKEYMFAVDRAHDPAFDPAVAEGRFTRMLRELSKLEQTPSWLREWIELERDAALLRWYEPAFVPGLLQTDAYARGMMNNGLLQPGEVDQRVGSRLDRQAILHRDVPVPLVAVIDVMVLRRPVDRRPDIMREQLEHLVTMSELPHVQILVVPEEAGIYPGLQGGFILATLGDGSVVAHLDHQVRAQVVNQTDDLATLQRTWEAVRGEALPRRQSLELIKEVAHSWT
ncbi:helix-turn-helix transcriptional regulator [Micromonospora sp. HNM0581]|uniref:helix-turn-helix domain-containing protein n=1 Tax=Micromonospora sp. HNM0581 TaxID=2716341 RepID=UPI00146DDE17|nr:helix-turn-helix transcriptional regulator [Micromonospora sp. HNM0581]NLU80457.1 helix-turn-helix transcriptional regulator [Micromonospora sp. HNM0581]